MWGKSPLKTQGLTNRHFREESHQAMVSFTSGTWHYQCNKVTNLVNFQMRSERETPRWNGWHSKMFKFKVRPCMLTILLQNISCLVIIGLLVMFRGLHEDFKRFPKWIFCNQEVAMPCGSQCKTINILFCGFSHKISNRISKEFRDIFYWKDGNKNKGAITSIPDSPQLLWHFPNYVPWILFPW